MSTDMTAPRDMAMALCGSPGSMGNSKGVGKYCTPTGNECSGNGSAVVCSAGFFPGTNFCTLAATCGSPPSPPADTVLCGENTFCQCSTSGTTAGLCGCTPAACGMLMDG